MTDDNLAREQEEEPVRRTLILVGEGEAPGIGAVVYAFVKTATRLGIEVYGSEGGFSGLIGEPCRVVELTPSGLQGVLSKARNLLGDSKDIDLFDSEIQGADTTEQGSDLWERVVQQLEDLEIDALVLVGGKRTMSIAVRLSNMGVAVLGIPESVGNELARTDQAPGFDTAVAHATSSLDALHHERGEEGLTVILEVRGSEVGWIALMCGIAGEADVILIPEIPYDPDRVVDILRSRGLAGHEVTVVVVAEGSKPLGATLRRIDDAHDFSTLRREGAGHRLAELLEGRIDQQVRVEALESGFWGDTPTPLDRVLGARLGVHAAELCYRDQADLLVVLRSQEVTSVPLGAKIPAARRVPPDGELVGVARAMGIELGQE